MTFLYIYIFIQLVTHHFARLENFKHYRSIIDQRIHNFSKNSNKQRLKDKYDNTTISQHTCGIWNMISCLFLFPNFFLNTVFNAPLTIYNITYYTNSPNNPINKTLIIIVETKNRKEVSSLLPSSTSPHAPD